jgi:hypothetical protein
MEIIEDLKGEVTQVIINKITGVNTGYHLKEQAKEEIIIDRIIFGNDNIQLIEIEDIENPLIIDETEKHGGEVRVNNIKMIETNGGYYSS